MHFRDILGQVLSPHCHKPPLASPPRHLSVCFVGWNYEHVMLVTIILPYLISITIFLVFTVL